MAYNSQFFLQLAGVLYLLALMNALVSGGRGPRDIFFLAPALAANLAALALRYHQAWPMLPMHLGAVALPLCLGLPALFTGKAHTPLERTSWRLLLALTALSACLALCFPKDFYLPFLKSKTLFAHGFLWFGLAGKSCLAVGASWALAALLIAPRGPEPPAAAIATAMRRCQRWLALGFVLWTLAMFSGEMWAYLGWGTPVVWEDPAIALTMAGWFFYTGLLHLHISRRWPLSARAACAALGGITVLGLTCLPDFGPFRSPWP